MQKILLDTDIGSDIDDSIALTYLLCQPACELVGITTVSGEPEKRAQLASAICRAAGKKIPIFAGTGEPNTDQTAPAARAAGGRLIRMAARNGVCAERRGYIYARYHLPKPGRDYTACDRPADKRCAAVFDLSGNGEAFKIGRADVRQLLQ